MIHIIIFMVIIYQGVNFCHGCNHPAYVATRGLVPDPAVDIAIEGGVFDGRRGLNSEVKNVSTCRIEDFEGLKELSHRVDSIQATDDQSIYQHDEGKRSGILKNKNMCHPEGEKFECYNDSNNNHCVCHLEQPLDHNNSNISDDQSLKEMGEERNWKQTFLARCFNSNNVLLVQIVTR